MATDAGVKQYYEKVSVHENSKGFIKEKLLCGMEAFHQTKKKFQSQGQRAFKVKSLELIKDCTSKRS